MASEKKNEQYLGEVIGALCAIVSLAVMVSGSTKKPVMNIPQPYSVTTNVNPDELKESKTEEAMLNYIAMEAEQAIPFDEDDANTSARATSH
ncbi:hypothetical protein [Enterobacter mori]|uniref:hypothetical protein n=1 Tax=Enterobacter mori TaxID=539813 RepID=UPI003B83C366